MPDSQFALEILETAHEHFLEATVAFEAFAARVLQAHENRLTIDEITRGIINGRKDAEGRYCLGLVGDPAYAEFSLEATYCGAQIVMPPIDGFSGIENRTDHAESWLGRDYAHR